MASPDGITSQQDSNSPNQLVGPQENQSESNNKEVHSDRGKGKTYLDNGLMQVEEFKTTQNVGVEYQNSIIPHPNVEMNGNVNSNMLQVTPPFDVKMHGSFRNMNEMNNTRIQKKRKLSKLESGNKFSIRCNCRNSKCLQRYCECFMAGVYCTKECGCTDCMNNEFYEDSVDLARQKIISKNPFAFAPKKVRHNEASSSRLKGCKCKQSMCRKNYCECFQAGVSCTEACGCENCHNPHGTREGCNHLDEQVWDKFASTSNNSSANLSLSNESDQMLEASDLDDLSKFLYWLCFGKRDQKTEKFYRYLLNHASLMQRVVTNPQQLRSIPPPMFALQPPASMLSNHPPRPPSQPSTSYSGRNDQTRGYNNITQQLPNYFPSTLNNCFLDSYSLHENDYVDTSNIDHETKALHNQFFANNNIDLRHPPEKELSQQRMFDPQHLMSTPPSNFAPQPSISMHSNQLPPQTNLPSHSSMPKSSSFRLDSRGSRQRY